MHKNQRQRQILQILKQRGGFISVKELCGLLYASESSVRRDLSALEKLFALRRTYGGVELIENASGGIDLQKRTHHNAEQKRIIAKKAARLVQNGSVIFLDQSSCAFYLACELMQNSTLTVLTNNTQILSLLSRSGMKTIASGGMLSSENRTCLIGTDAERIFREVCADFVFFSTKALGSDGVISDCSREEVCVREAMLQGAKVRVYLCDSEKFDTGAAYRQCTLSDVDYLVSENDGDGRFLTVAPNLIVL